MMREGWTRREKKSVQNSREREKRSSLGKGIGEAYEQSRGRRESLAMILVPLTTCRRGRLQIITWACLGLGTAGGNCPLSIVVLALACHSRPAI